MPIFLNLHISNFSIFLSIFNFVSLSGLFKGMNTAILIDPKTPCAQKHFRWTLRSSKNGFQILSWKANTRVTSPFWWLWNKNCCYRRESVHSFVSEVLAHLFSDGFLMLNNQRTNSPAGNNTHHFFKFAEKKSGQEKNHEPNLGVNQDSWLKKNQQEMHLQHRPLFSQLCLCWSYKKSSVSVQKKAYSYLLCRQCHIYTTLTKSRDSLLRMIRNPYKHSQTCT